MFDMVSALANFGFGGAMAGAFIYIHYHLVNKFLPSIIEYFNKQMDQERKFHAEQLNKEREINLTLHENLTEKLDRNHEVIVGNSNNILRLIEAGFQAKGRAG